MTAKRKLSIFNLIYERIINVASYISKSSSIYIKIHKSIYNIFKHGGRKVMQIETLAFTTQNNHKNEASSVKQFHPKDCKQVNIPSISNLLIWLNQLVLELQNNNGGLSKQYKLSDYPAKSFTNKLQEYRYNQKRLVARSFCYGGYGIPFLQQQLGQYAQLIPINTQKYEIIVRGVMTQAYRKMQIFLIDDCQRDIQKMKTLQQMQHLYSILLNYRSTLGEEQKQTFIGFIQVIYGLADVLLLERKVLKLYIAVLTKYQQNTKNQNIITQNQSFIIDEDQLVQAHQDDWIWSNQEDMELMKKYKQTSNYIIIKDSFIARNSKWKKYSVNVFIARFQKNIKNSLAKLEELCKMNKEMGISIQLNEQQTNAIIYSENAQEIRMKLVDAFLDAFTQKTILKDTSLAIKNYLNKRLHLDLNRPSQPSKYFINPKATNKQVIYFIPPPIKTNSTNPIDNNVDQFQMIENFQDEIMQGLQFLKMGNNFDNFSDMDVQQFEID